MKAASLAQFLLFIHAAGGNISKCIRKDDTISFNCPEGHVVYQPTIFVGKSTSNTCTHGPGDCTGMTYELKLQRQKCFWQKKCSFRWRDQQPIMSSNNTQCLMEMPNYVSFENPVCVSSGHVFDVCSDPDLTSVTHGVIRSHPDYPWNYQATSQHCKVTLPAKHGRRLVVTVDDVDVDVADGDIVVIRKLSLKSGAELFINPAKKGDRIDSNYTAKIEVIYTVRAKSHAGEKKGNGFILRFEYSSSQTTQQPNNQHSLTSHNLFTNSLFNVFGAVEECITPKREKINITCPEGHVIFKPEVKVGVSTDGRCFNKLGDCVGLTYTFLTQKNVCYWKESCEFSWRTGVPITMSQSLRCLSLPPKYISVSGYSCIEEGVSAKIIKCIERNQYKVNLNCPADHVIYRPMIYLGANPTNTCQEGEGDCAGVPLELEKEMKSCFWQPSCKLSWNKSQTFTNPSCQGMAPTYAVYDNPTCVRNDELYDIGSRDDDDRLSSMFKGIIRSSGNYPYHFKDLRSSSVRKLPSRPGHSLILTIDDLDLRGQNSLTIYTNSEEKKTLLRKKVAKDETFQVAGENIYILFNITAGDRPGGFILRFEYKKDEISNNVMLSNHGYPGRSVSVKGSLDTCIARKDSMRIVCPDDHVIFQPDVTTGVSNGGKCLKMDGDCQGLTHSLITEINRCYWRSTCRLTWRKGIPLTMTNTLNCLAQYPDYISVKNYECIKKDYVYGMCENKEINSTEGIIVSHSNYPWHYSTKATVCRKYVSVDSNVGMRIYTQQIDLDPDSKGDNIKFYVGSSKKPVKKIMAGQRADLTFEGGCVMIKFTVSKRSKGGQGFILRFEPPGKYPTKMKKTEDITCEEMFKQRRLTSTQHFAADSGSKKKDRQMRKQTRRKMQRGQDKEKEKAMSDAKKPEVSRRLYNVDRIMKRKQRKNRQGRKGKGNRKRKSSKRGRRRRKGKKGRKNKGRRISKHVRPFFPY